MELFGGGNEVRSCETQSIGKEMPSKARRRMRRSSYEQRRFAKAKCRNESQCFERRRHRHARLRKGIGGNSTEKQCCAKAKCGAEQTHEVAVKFRSACAVTQRQVTAALGPTANGGAKALLRTEAC